MVESNMEPHSFAKSVDELYEKIEEHYQFLLDKNLLQERAHRKVMTEINDALRSAVLEPVLNKLIETGEFDKMVEKLMKKETDPYTLADEVASNYLIK